MPGAGCRDGGSAPGRGAAAGRGGLPWGPGRLALGGGAMEAPAELLAALPALATALALLLAWLLVRRGAAASPEPVPPAEATEAPALSSPYAPESAAVPAEPEEPGEPAGPEEPGEPAGPGEPEEPRKPTAAPAEAEEQTAESRQEEEQDLDGEKGPSSAGPEEEDGEGFSFKYSPGKLRGNQYKKMMTKEELEEEQRIELTSDLTSL
uniref:Matrix-remodeling-associated protein 7 helical domain-containing protein n=2 Tax=Callithrix jacchus TaxID=9483 RepID=A0A2R8MTY2_CALJA